MDLLEKEEKITQKEKENDRILSREKSNLQ